MNESVKVLELSIIENNLEESNDNEEKLNMAAKLGAALLEENQLLIHKNQNLLAKMATLEALIEEAASKEITYLAKIKVLEENYHEIHLQAEKRKSDCLEIQSMFEEHGKEQTQLITGYIKEIDNLKKLTTKLQAVAEKRERAEKAESENQSRECQTDLDLTTPTIMQSSFIPRILSDPTELENSLNSLKNRVESLETQIQYHSFKTENKQQSKKTKTLKQSTFNKSIPWKKGRNCFYVSQKRIEANTATHEEPILEHLSDSKSGHVIKLDGVTRRNVEKHELSDDEDTDTHQTRSLCRRIIRKTAVRTNTGRLSFLNPQDEEETEVTNHLRLYNSVKGIGSRDTVGTRLKLVQGSPWLRENYLYYQQP
ncbi:hypothetical protein J6590_027201 [Homalodisca vitripennis]|nr:hypothetical protein J6590_027201 [Homalodisca vitripennis]